MNRLRILRQNRPFARWRHFTKYDRNPSGCCFLVQIKAFVNKTSLGLTNFNMKVKNEMNCGLSRKKTSSCKWPIVDRFHFLELTGRNSQLEYSYVDI